MMQRTAGPFFQAKEHCSKLFAIYCLAIIILLAPAYGQDFRASITGQVADSTGAVIPDASITAVNIDTRLAYPTKSEKQGVYSLLYLLPGSYTVTVHAKNFQTMVYNNVVLDSAQQLGLNVTLKPGNVTQEVVVTAGTVELDTVSASTGGVIDQTKVENMPSAGLQVFDDVSFTEGIRADSANTFSYTPRNSANLYAVSGSQTDESTFYVNGAPVSDVNDVGTWYFVPNQESTSQVQANVMPYDAQYGRTGGGVFNVNIKNGTNAFHGSVYDYYDNAALNANTWAADLAHAAKAINIHTVFGGESGGPIRKDKTFYFGSYEGYRQTDPTVITETVPLAAWRNGNFLGSPYTIYDPLSTYCSKPAAGGGCTTYARTEFPLDAIPSTRISPIGQAILNMYPLPTNPTANTNNYVTKRQTSYRYDQYIGRLDQNFSANSRLFALATLQNDGFIDGTNAFPTAGSSLTSNPIRDYNIILGFTQVFSSSKVLDLKASYGHYVSTTEGASYQNNVLASALGFNMPMVGTATRQNLVPDMTVTGMTALFADQDNGGAAMDADFSGSVTQLVGRHNLHYGAEFMDTQSTPVGAPGTPNGTFTFGPGYTQANPLTAKSGQGFSAADILLGYPTSGSVTWSSNVFKVFHYYGLYLQDDFKVLPNLTLNLGLRWDVNGSVSDRHNRMNAGFCLTCTNPYTSQINYALAPGMQNPLLGGYQFAGVNGIPSAPFEVFWNDWQPRFGFSWAALPNTVIRGGYGIYDTVPYADVNQQGFSETTSFIASLNGTLTPDNYFNSGTPYPTGAIVPTGSASGLETSAGNAAGYANLNRAIRMTQHWSLGFQRKMPGSVLLDIEYMGTTVHHIPVATSLGVISTAQQQECFATGAVCNTNVTNPFYGVLASNTTLGASTTIPQWELQRAYPLFNGVVEDDVPAGSSSFNSFNVRAERRLKSLDFVFNYVYSNWMDTDSYLNNGSFRDANLTRSLDPSDERNYIDTNIVYPLPSTSKNGWIGALANRWLFDSTVMWGTGTPLALPSATLTGAPGCTSYAPIGGQTRAHWFNNNESCWTQLATWQPQTTPTNIGFIRNPSFVIWNPAFHKQFKLPYRGMVAQFRMEAINGANHPTFGAPSVAIGTAPSFSPKTSWTGFGTLPAASGRNPREIMSSLKIIF